MFSKSKSLVDFQLIKREVSISDILDHYGVWSAFKGSGAQQRGPCPICDSASKRKFNANTRKNIWYCFGDCKKGGNVIDFVIAMEGCDARDAALKLADWFGIEAQQQPQKRRATNGEAKSSKRSKKAKKDRLQEPDPCVEGSRPNKPLTFDCLKHLQFDHEALIARGVMSDTAEHFGVGYATKGIMRGCIAIPVHDLEGHLLAYAGADPESADAPYRWPKDFRPGIELYNAHRAVEAQKTSKVGLIVVCDFFDVFELYEAGVGRVVALMGEGLGPEQLAILRQLLNSLRAPRITFAYHFERLDDAPPYELIGKLATAAQCHAVTLESLTN